MAGPLNVERPPHGYPLLVQAGSSEDGKDFAARHAEAIFTAHTTYERAAAFHADIKARTGAAGRDPDGVIVLPGIVPTTGSTEEEARALAPQFDELRVPEYGLRQLAGVFETELSVFQLDALLPDFIFARPKLGRAWRRSSSTCRRSCAARACSARSTRARRCASTTGSRSPRTSSMADPHSGPDPLPMADPLATPAASTSRSGGSPPALRVEGLRKTYEDGFTAVTGLDLEIPDGACREDHADRRGLEPPGVGAAATGRERRSSRVIEIVEPDRCIACDRCLDVCPTRVFDRGADGIPVIARQDTCQTCFQREAYCPTDAAPLFVAPLVTAVAPGSRFRDVTELEESGLLGGYRRELGWGRERTLGARTAVGPEHPD